jgi:5-methylcytosine-specific restriction endonuclease McrBC regulatory subunit McrC
MIEDQRPRDVPAHNQLLATDHVIPAPLEQDDAPRNPVLIEGRSSELGTIAPGWLADLLELERQIEITNLRLCKALGLRKRPIQLRHGSSPTVTVSGVAGTITLAGIAIDIAPKYLGVDDAQDTSWTTTLALMLEATGHSKVSFSSSVGFAQGELNFADRMAFAYAAELGRALKGPPIRQYVQFDDEGRVLRGRLRIVAQLRLSLTRPDLVAFERSDLDTDNDYNRLLAQAGRRLLSTALRPDIRRRLQSQLDQVPRHGGSRRPRRTDLIVPRQYSHYGPAIALATVVTAGRSLDRGVTSLSGADFVVNVERLFELFLESRLAAISSSQPWSVRAQHKEIFASSTSGRSDYFSKPDNVLVLHNENQLVLDAKYKRFSESVEDATSKPSNSDIYQMVAAGLAHQTTTALLVYPKLSGHVDREQSDLDITSASGAPLDNTGHNVGRLGDDPPVNEIAWWTTPISYSEMISVGATRLDLGMIRDARTLEQFDDDLLLVLNQALVRAEESLENKGENLLATPKDAL